MSIRDKLEGTKKPPAELGDVAETYGLAALVSGVLGGLYFFVATPSFSFTLFSIFNGFLFFCLLVSTSWLGLFAVNKMKDPDSFEHIDPPDPISLHRYREQFFGRFKKPPRRRR